MANKIEKLLAYFGEKVHEAKLEDGGRDEGEADVNKAVKCSETITIESTIPLVTFRLK